VGTVVVIADPVELTVKVAAGVPLNMTLVAPVKWLTLGLVDLYVVDGLVRSPP
jgi:hypothetical protein